MVDKLYLKEYYFKNSLANAKVLGEQLKGCDTSLLEPWQKTVLESHLKMIEKGVALENKLLKQENLYWEFKYILNQFKSHGLEFALFLQELTDNYYCYMTLKDRYDEEDKMDKNNFFFEMIRSVIEVSKKHDLLNGNE